MKNKIIISGIYVLLGILLIAGLNTLFKPCESEMKMACNYTANVGIYLGVIFIISGIILYFFNGKTRAGIALIQIILGVFTILLPVTIVGVCKNSDMMCNIGIKPFLLIIGGIIVLVSSGNAIYLLRKEE